MACEKPQSSSKPNHTTLKQRFRYAAQEFGRISTKSNHVIPKEQQLSIDLGNKLLFNYKTRQFIPLPLTCKSASYIYEVGSDKKIFGIGYDCPLKYFTTEEQIQHTRTPKQDEKGEWRLYNYNGSVYDTTKINFECGRILYAITLDYQIVTAKEILASEDVEYCCWHSSLLNGGPGLCFGTIVVKEGKIVYLNNHSGHYMPSVENLYNVITKIIHLFSHDALVRLFFKSFDENGNLRCNKNATKFLSENYYCTLKEFLGKVESKESVVPGDERIIMPENYFGSIKEYNDRYKNILLYKPVAAVNNNVKLAVEHSIRKFLGLQYGHKPILGLDDESGRITIYFKDGRDSLQFYSILHEICVYCSVFEENAEISYLKDVNTIYVIKKYMWEFVRNVLNINFDEWLLFGK